MPNNGEDKKYESSLQSTVIGIDSIFKSKEIHNENIKVLITSPTPSCGKTTTSLALARMYASLGKKVLLYDLDLKKGDLHKLIPENRIKFEDFLNINVKADALKLRTIICNTKI